jgi:hypothetical protein
MCPRHEYRNERFRTVSFSVRDIEHTSEDYDTQPVPTICDGALTSTSPLPTLQDRLMLLYWSVATCC